MDENAVIENQENTSQADKTKMYSYGLDIIRIIAMILVVTVHSTSNNFWVAERQGDLINFLVGAGRYLSYACVPLFVMLSGYLCKDKKPTLDYYLKLVRVAVEYLICSGLVCVFRYFIMDQAFSLREVLEGILDFSMAPYSWYVNLYIGLFLLIPFLNMLYNSIGSNKHKLLFVCLLLIVFALPATSGLFSFDYWTIGYPLMYYFLGCFLKDNKLRIKKGCLLLILLAIISLESASSIFRFPYLNIENHSNIFCVAVSVIIFLLFCDLKKDKESYSTKVSRAIAGASLSFLMLSYIFDRFFIKFLFERLQLNSFKERLPHLIYVSILTIVLSIALALVVSTIASLIAKLINKAIVKIRIRNEQKKAQA